MRKIDFWCLTCKKGFVSKKCDKNRTPKYCSRKCYGLSIAKFKECRNCRKEFYNYENKFFCSMKCAGQYKRGKRFNRKHKEGLSLAKRGKPIKHFIERKDEIREKISRALLGKSQPWNRGENHPNWQGGKTEKNFKIRNSLKMKIWKRKVLKRDNYICQACKKRGGRLVADHVKPFSLYPKLRFRVENGRAICKKCDLKSDTYGGRVGKVKS